jgi:hypothetical protein
LSARQPACHHPHHEHQASQLRGRPQAKVSGGHRRHRECDRAVYWAAKRAGRTKSQIVMLRVIEPGDRNQQWLGVADIMMAEQQEAANAALDKFAARAKKIARSHPIAWSVKAIRQRKSSS